MKQGCFTIRENVQLTPSTWRMRLAGDTSGIAAPGQFINIRLDGHFLRRPISVCDVVQPEVYTGEGLPSSGDEGVSGGVVTIIYKVLGHGTQEMTRYERGRTLDVLTGLGNGYDLEDAGARPLLIGGGVGIPPMYLAARLLMQRADACSVTVILGFNSEEEMYYVREFEELGCRVIVSTADGSTGIRGFVTDAFRELAAEHGSSCSEEISAGGCADTGSGRFTHFYTCGPEPMLRAVYNDVYSKAGISGQMSFEERMGCGFGACMGCSIRTRNGSKRICKDGPVLRTEEIIWD